MWVLTENGFISVVEKPEQVNTDELCVRARDAESLIDVCRFLGLEPGRHVKVTLNGDYPYRMNVPRHELGLYLANAVRNVDYPNFKDRVTERHGKTWHDALMRVWGNLLALTPEKVRRGQQLARDANSIQRERVRAR